MNFTFDYRLGWEYRTFVLNGIYETLKLTGYSLSVAILVGLFIGLGLSSKKSFISAPLRIYVEIFRNTPPLVQIIWIYYCLPMFLGWELVAFSAGVIALGVGFGAYMGEVFRAGIQSVDEGEIEAARSLGMSHFQTLRKITLPHAVRTMIPPFVNTTVALLKSTSLVSIFGVRELTYSARTIATTTFKPIEMFTTIAIIYFLICTLLSRTSKVIEKRLTQYR
jgi:His/Glu/Gln/Arg/opine family amino acid ABC transporter permease subunit